MEDRIIKIALLGLGTVGLGTYKVLKAQEQEMVPKTGARLVVSRILVRNKKKAADKIGDASLITDDFRFIGKWRWRRCARASMS